MKTLTMPSRRCSGVSTRLGTGRSMGRGSSRSSHADSRTGRPRGRADDAGRSDPLGAKVPKRDDFDGAPSLWRSHLCWPEHFGAVSTGCGSSKVVPYGQNPGLSLSLTPAGSGRRAPMRQTTLLPRCAVGGRLIEVFQHFRQTCLCQCLAAGLRDLDGPAPPDARDPGPIEECLRQCGPQWPAEVEPPLGGVHARLPAGTKRLLQPPGSQEIPSGIG